MAGIEVGSPPASATGTSQITNAYQVLYIASTKLPASAGANTLVFAPTAATQSSAITASTSFFAANLSAYTPFYYDDALFGVSGLTPKFNIQYTVTTNDTAPAVNITPGLYPFTVSGATTTHLVTLGTVVAGSTNLFTTPAADSKVTAVTGDFTVPADGHYLFGFVNSGTSAANSETIITAQLMHRNV